MSPPSKKHANSEVTFTWQQQQDFGAKRTPRRRKRNRKTPKFVSVSPESIAAVNSLLDVQQQKPACGHQSKGVNNAATRGSPHQSKQPVPTDFSTATRIHDSIPKEPPIATEKPGKGNIYRVSKIADMTVRPSGVYLPPHMRKHAAAPIEAKTAVQLGDFIGISSPPASVKCQSGKIDHKPVSSNVVVTQDQTLPSPPTTVEDPPRPSGGYSGWDEPQPEQPPAPPRRNGDRFWPRAPKAEKHVWPKARDIPKLLSEGSQSDGGVSFKSDSGGDPSYDVKKLMDWNGDWLPPPEEWAARKGYTNHHFGQVVEKWADGHSKLCTKLMDTDSPAFLGVESTDGKWTTKDLVPQYWLHDKIDNDSLRKFWGEFPHRAPAPLSDIDVMEDPPYWERWDNDQPTHCFMNALVVPEARIDKKNSDNELESPFAMLCTTDRLARIQEIRESSERRREARRNRPIRPIAQLVPQMPERSLRPKANIYLRPVQPADVRGVMIIYNHYVAKTIHAHELDERTEADIRCHIDGIIKAGLPFLVAVAKRNQRKGPQGYVNETIVGYVYISDYIGQSSMYRYTFKLDLFVHPGYIRQGIGKCLLDKIMFMVNTSYNAKGGYEWVNDFEYLKNGYSRVVKTVLITLHYERGDEIEWATSYLGEFGFKKAGRFAQVGFKDGKVVDKVMYQLQTAEVIDPRSIAMVQG